MQTIENCKQNAMHGTADWVQFIVKALILNIFSFDSSR